MTSKEISVMATGFAAEGFSVREIASLLDMSVQKFYRWRGKHPIFDAKFRRQLRERNQDQNNLPLELFSGEPVGTAEVARRATVLRQLRHLSAVEVGPGART